jgi:uncharacterized DUF497 family protein
LVVIYSAHAEQKLSTRSIRREDVDRVITNPNELFEDTEHKAKVAVGRLDAMFLFAVYQHVNDDVKVITVYCARKLEKLVTSKVQRGAWRRIR